MIMWLEMYIFMTSEWDVFGEMILKNWERKFKVYAFFFQLEGKINELVFWRMLQSWDILG